MIINANKTIRLLKYYVNLELTPNKMIMKSAKDIRDKKLTHLLHF
jgi:hypothetical protein